VAGRLPLARSWHYLAAMAPSGSPTLNRHTGLRIVNLDISGGAGSADLADPLAEFHSEAEPPRLAPVTTPRAIPSHVAVSLPPRPQPSRWSSRRLVCLLAAVVIIEAPFVVMWTRGQLAGSVGTGTVYVETEPAGAEVWLDGQMRGVTPTRLSIPRGAATLVLRREGAVRTVPLTIVPAEVVRLRVDLPSTPAESAASHADLPDPLAP